MLDLLFPKLPGNNPLSLCNKILKLQSKLSKIEVVRGIVFCTGHYPKLQKWLCLLFLVTMAISQRIVVKMPLKFQNNKFNGVEVLQVLAMSGMALPV